MRRRDGRDAILAGAILAGVLAVPAGAQGPSAPVSPAGAEAAIARALRERLDAYGRADAEAWGRYVADDCVCGLSGKAALQQEIGARPAGVRMWSGEISALEIRRQGNAAAIRRSPRSIRGPTTPSSAATRTGRASWTW
jgi:hypothetical protein